MAFMTDRQGGIICVYKPKGFTSFDVIAKMRGILKFKRLGHAGTLDPMAEGVLPVFVGNATKACDILENHDKTYYAGFKLGVTTDTQDSTGIVISEIGISVSFESLNSAAAEFTGEIMQIPPMYSAVSVNGKRLYELAREGKTIERKPRKITVYSLNIDKYDSAERCGFMKISCSKGTYIRTLISDIGDRLGCGGIMTSLVRTSACGFDLDDCITLEQLQSEADGERNFNRFLIPTAVLFESLPKIFLSDVQERMYKNGIRLDLNRINIKDKSAGRYAVYGAENNFIGTAVIIKEQQILKIEKNFF